MFAADHNVAVRYQLLVSNNQANLFPMLVEKFRSLIEIPSSTFFNFSLDMDHYNWVIRQSTETNPKFCFLLLEFLDIHA